MKYILLFLILLALLYLTKSKETFIPTCESYKKYNMKPNCICETNKKPLHFNDVWTCLI